MLVIIFSEVFFPVKITIALNQWLIEKISFSTDSPTADWWRGFLPTSSYFLVLVGQVGKVCVGLMKFLSFSIFPVLAINVSSCHYTIKNNCFKSIFIDASTRSFLINRNLDGWCVYCRPHSQPFLSTQLNECEEVCRMVDVDVKKTVVEPVCSDQVTQQCKDVPEQQCKTVKKDNEHFWTTLPLLAEMIGSSLRV